MSADYSRWPIRRRDFAQVRLQQGRVLTDADWNEEILVSERRERLETIDGLGRAVVPTATPDAFRITPAGADLSIGIGRAYLDGLLLENHGAPAAFDPVLAERAGAGPVNYSSQPWLRNPPPLPAPPYVAYLKAWQRERTAVSEPDLIEPALGVDTAARLQTVWQVKTVSAPAGTTCAGADPLIAAAEPAAAGRLTTGTAVVPGQPDPCRVVPGGGYTGLENQLYRVEIHRGGAVGGGAGATFKWSRDNGTVAARVLSVNAARDRIVVDSLGRDDVLGVHDGDWIEITDDDHDLSGTPGELRRIAIGGGVDQATRTILLSSPLPAAGSAFPVDAQLRTLPELNTRIRRWDQTGKVLNGTGGVIVDLDGAAASGAIPVPGSTVSVLLEHGIVVRFALEGAGRFRTGDYWLFTARTADASVEPLDTAPPIGIHAHFAPLAIVANPPTDCRTVIPPLGEMESLRYVGGDGQEATPSYVNPGPIALPVPATVGVERGSIPVAGRQVRFTIVDFPNAGSLPGPGAASRVLPTGLDGLASVIWTLGWDGRESQKKQELIAELLDDAGNVVGLPVHFSARLRTADEVAYNPKDCPDLAGIGTVQAAVDALCGRASGDGCCLPVRPRESIAEAIKRSAERRNGHACLCLSPGVYELAEADLTEIATVLKDLPVTSLAISGSGAQILLGSTWTISGLVGVELNGIELADSSEDLDALLEFMDCAAVTLVGVEADLTMGRPDSTVVRIGNSESAGDLPAVRIRDCRITNGKRDQKPVQFVMEDLPDTVQGMIALAHSDSPAADTVSGYRALMEQPLEVRTAEADKLRSLATDSATLLDAATTRSMVRLGTIIQEGKALPLSRLTGILDRARTVGDKFSTTVDAPTAVEFLDGRADVRIEDNLIDGKIVLYGRVARPEFEVTLQRNLEAIDWSGIEPGAKAPELPAGVGQLRVTDNRVARITLAADAAERLVGYLGGAGKLRETSLFDGIVISGNAFSAPRQAIVGQLVTLASNTIAGDQKASMGFALANAATMVGNIGSSRGRFYLAAWDAAEAANRRMDVEPKTHPLP